MINKRVYMTDKDKVFIVEIVAAYQRGELSAHEVKALIEAITNN